MEPVLLGAARKGARPTLQMRWRALMGKKPMLIINFISDAPGGTDLVRNALESDRTGAPFILPPSWRVVNAIAGMHNVKEKTLHLEYIGDGGGDNPDDAVQPDPAGPSELEAFEPVK